jgi:hypothetical protein
MSHRIGLPELLALLAPSLFSGRSFVHEGPVENGRL